MSYPNRSRVSITLVFFLVIIASVIFLFFYIKNQFAAKTEINQDIMVTKITAMGKLELVKYSMKDVVEKKGVKMDQEYMK